MGERDSISPEDVAWLVQQLDESSAAPTKRYYLLRFHASGDSSQRIGDPMGLSRHEAWTLPLLLWAARLITCDERTLWECLGPSFPLAFEAPLHPWNEQQAVKLVHRFLRRSSASQDALEQELARYAAAQLVPEGSSRVAGGVVEDGVEATAAPLGSISTDPYRFGSVRVVPMREGDAYSEGSLECAAPVRAFGELLRVPRKDMFYAGSVVEHCALGRVIAGDPRLSSLRGNEEALLVLCFIYEYFLVGPQRSHWSRLLRHCPPAYPTVPTFMALSTLAELSGLDMVDEVMARRAQTATVHEAVRGAIPLLYEGLCGATGASPVPDAAAFEAAFTVENMTFATATFDSRAFNLHVDGVDVLSLVPWADMINHQNRSDVLVRRVEEGGGDFVMEVGAALGPADVGRELWMSYGPLQNWELLQYYGFALDDNEYDQLPFPFAADEAIAGDDAGEEWAARRRALVEQYSLYGAGRCWVGHSGVPCAALCALLRVCLAPATEFAVMEDGADGPFTPLSADTEALIVATIRATVDAVLAQFPTTLEEDREMLTELDGPQEEEEEEHLDEHAKTCLRLCLRVRMGLKQIAERLYRWLAAQEEEASLQR